MATRATWVENLFGGLDKMYLIHRRSGVIAVILLLAHFIVVPRAIDFNPGKPLGFYALVLILIGVIVSAVPVFKKKIPYHKWINFHKLMGVFYTLGIIHGFMVDSLIKQLPITRIYVFSMAMIGILAWVYKAFLFGLFNKKLNYAVKQVKNLGNNITELELVAQNKSLTFKAGQFAFITFPSISKKEQHPFTISSHPHQKNLKITIKGLGDYTTNFTNKVNINDDVFVEGPYGKFSSGYSKEKEQVWIAGGIGITPFLALINDYYTNKVVLYWCVNNESEAVYKTQLETIAKSNPLFEFVLWNSEKRGHITVDDLSIRDPEKRAYLICGPKALKENITKQLKQEGVKQSSIYDEEFTFR